MKKIMLLGCLMCSAFAWADYDHCVTNAQGNFYSCLGRTTSLGYNSSNPKSVELCKNVYKFGLAQCKEVYINKGK
jgi:hypothetical protein